VAGYYIYRTTIPSGSVVKLNSTPVNSTQYVDHYVEAGKKYSYSITSVDSKGIESKPSTGVSTSIPTP